MVLHFFIMVCNNAVSSTMVNTVQYSSYFFVSCYTVASQHLTSVNNVSVALHGLVGWLVVWVLWHINLCRLSNAKSIFIQIISSVSNNSI